MEEQQNKELTEHEKKELRRQQKEEEKNKQQAVASKEARKNTAKKAGIGMAVVLLISVLAIKYVNAPGQYDEFAKCLAEKGAVIYGAEFCKYTAEQKAMFGKSEKHLNYKDYTERKDIKITPTWIVNGQRYEKVQSFEKLSELTGCKF